MKKFGFTLVEVLVSISIVIILVAIMTPALVGAKLWVKITVSKSNLRQVFLAAKLYQQDWDEKVEYGPASQMGLPTFAGWYGNVMNLDEDLRRSPCRSPNSDRYGWSAYMWAPDDSEGWIELVKKREGGAILTVDMACNDLSGPIRSEWIQKRGIAVTVDGTILTKFKAGEWSNPNWWYE